MKNYTCSSDPVPRACSKSGLSVKRYRMGPGINKILVKRIAMRLQLITLFLIAALVQAGATGYGQGVTISEKRTSVQKVLNQLEKQTGYVFFYNAEDISGLKVRVELKNTPALDAIEVFFKDLPLTYRVIGNTVAIKKKLQSQPAIPVTDTASTAPPLPPDQVITGMVRDEKGEPLPGVNILIKGTQTGTITNSAGKFQLNIPSPNGTQTSVLVFSFVGYKSKEVSVSGNKDLNVSLDEDVALLNEVVAVGYGSIKKVNLTGAVDQVGSEYFENRPVPNVARSLQGVIPNLNISLVDGKPTSSPTFNVRGLTSIGAGGEALVLIDGISGDPAFLNPDDIKSVTVLKDAASAAIYGARGAFGVILITTKTPDKTRNQINYSAGFSLRDRTVKRDLITDGYTWAKSFSQAYSGWYDNAALPAVIGATGMPFSTEYLEALRLRSESKTPMPEVEIDPATGNYVYYGNTDWEKLLYAGTTSAQDHSLSISGGTEKLDYLISGKYNGSEGIYKLASDRFNRYSLRIKGGVEVTKWLKISSNTNFSTFSYTDPFRGTNVLSGLNISGFGAPMAVLYNPDGTLTRQAAGALGIMLGDSENRSKRILFQQDVSFAATFLNNRLNIKGDASFQNIRTDAVNKLISDVYSVKPGEIIDNNVRQLNKSSSLQGYDTYNLYADYSQNFSKHNLKVLAGMNMEESRLENMGMTRDNLLIPALSDFNLAVGDNISLTNGGNQWSTAGVFSRINYNYDEKYLLEFNGRYDGSSKFPSRQKFGFFPSVSAGWRVSQEKFMANAQSWLSDFKLRASYGSLGNSQIAPYLFLEQLRATRGSYILNGQLPTFISNPAVIADDFTWETARTLNVGFDFSSFENRLSATFDWYNRETLDMITAGPQLPLVFGAAIPRGNYADLNTKGYEISLTWKDQINTPKPIRYDLRLTLSDNWSTITRFNNPQKLIIQDDNTFALNFYEGQRYGDIWGYETEGFFQSEADIKAHANQSAVVVSGGNIITPGDIKFRDLNGDGKINKGSRTLADHGDWKIIGNSRPRYSYGVTTNVSWNNFSLSLFFQGIGKRDWYPSYGATEFWGQYSVWYGSIPRHTYENQWTPEDPDAYFPRYKGPMPYGERQLQPQTKYLQDASYIRLKNLMVSYTIPKKITNLVRMKGGSVYFSGENIWTYSPMYKLTRDIDPETIGNLTTGYHGHAYPMLKTYTLGVNITL